MENKVLYAFLVAFKGMIVFLGEKKRKTRF